LPSLSSLLLKIPDEFKPMAAIGMGSLILVTLVLFHGLGIHNILVRFKRGEIRLEHGRPHLGLAGLLFARAVFFMLCLHIFEIMAWAFVLNHLGLIPRPADAIYFCANAYTTLGYGAVDLSPLWRNISPIIAISGLFTFAWTASSLVNIVGGYIKLVGQLEEERLQELDMRRAERRAEWDAMRQESQMEQQSRVESGKREAGASFFERRRIRHEERQEENKLRAAARSEIGQLRRKEREDEDKLGQPPPESGGPDS